VKNSARARAPAVNYWKNNNALRGEKIMQNQNGGLFVKFTIKNSSKIFLEMSKAPNFCFVVDSYEKALNKVRSP